MSTPENLKARAESIYKELRSLKQEAVDAEINLSTDEDLMATIKAIKEELGVDSSKTGTWPDCGPSVACHWCLAGAGR